MRFAALVLALAVAGSSLAAEPAKVDPHKAQSIHTLLELTGVVKVAQQMIGQIFDQFAKDAPSVPAEAWQKLRKKMNGDEMVELMIPIYDKYYTQEEVDGMIAFYRTPLGQKVISTMPAISQEGFQVGQEWGRRKAAEVVKELRAEGLLKDER